MGREQASSSCVASIRPRPRAGGDLPAPDASLLGERDLDYMLHDIDFAADMTPRFFRPTMRDGVVDVPRPDWLPPADAAPGGRPPEKEARA
jgi:hypothetical protein